MKKPITKSQQFMAILNTLLPKASVPKQIKKTTNGYSTIGFLKDCSSEVVYDVKNDIVRVSKLFKEYISHDEYETKEDIKRYKVEFKPDRMFLYPFN